MQEVRGSIPGRGTTDFCTLILFVYIYIYIIYIYKLMFGFSAREPRESIRDAGRCIFDKLDYLLMHGKNIDLMNIVDSSYTTTAAGFSKALRAAQVRFSSY